MKRIIKASTSIKASVVPPEYARLAKALREASKAINECVDKNLEGYIYWDKVQAYLRSGLEAISKAGHDLEENAYLPDDDIIEEATSARSKHYIKSGLDDSFPKFIKVNDDFVEIDSADWCKCLRIPADEYAELPQNIQDLIEDHDLLRGQDSESYMFIVVDGGNMQSVSDEDYEVLKSAGISMSNNSVEKVMLQEHYI